MKKMSSYIGHVFDNIDSASSEHLRRAMRAGAVRGIWAELVEDVFLQHTNGVYILKEDGRTIMHVYVDESIYAAELNARRELIMHQCKSRYGEAIDEFQIHISYGSMKKVYPYRADTTFLPDQNPSVPLSPEELAAVETSCSCVENERLRAELKKAMIADLEWKKGNPQ